MKKLFPAFITILFMVFLSACGSNNDRAFNFDIKHVEDVVKTAYGEGNYTLKKEKDYYSIILSDATVLRIDVNDNDEITSVKAGVTLDGYAAGKTQEMFKAFQVVFNIVDSKIGVGGKEKVMNDLNIDVNTDFLKNEKTTTYHDINYSISSNDDFILLEADPGINYGK
jgi:hypothetical protein